jgi:hypothetical protein
MRLTGIENKLLVDFIDGIVSQMDEVILQILLFCLLVVLSGKASQPLLIDIDSQRVAAIDKYVDPHVELQPIDQKGVVHIELHDSSFTLQLFYLGEKHDSFPLRRCLRLEDVDRLLFF